MKNENYKRFVDHASCYLPDDIPSHMGVLALQAVDEDNVVDIIEFISNNSVAAKRRFWQVVFEAPKNEIEWQNKLKAPNGFDTYEEYFDSQVKHRIQVELVRKNSPKDMNMYEKYFNP